MKGQNASLSSLSDTQLVSCYVGGDNRCYGELIDRHHHHVQTLLHYKLHNAEWEKDAWQETCMVAAEEIRNGTYRDSGKLDKWFNSVALHCAMEIMRREKHYVHDNTAFALYEPAAEPEEEIYPERSKGIALLREAMKKLSSNHRLALQLRDVDELSFAQIGALMGISEVSARTTHYKAKARVKHWMQILQHELLSKRRSI